MKVRQRSSGRVHFALTSYATRSVERYGERYESPLLADVQTLCGSSLRNERKAVLVIDDAEKVSCRMCVRVARVVADTARAVAH